MPIRSHWLPIVLLAVVAPARSAPAQAPGGRDSASQALARALVRLTPGTHVRVHAPALGRVAGPLVSSSSSALHLRTGPTETIAPIAEIDSLWVRGRATKTGAIVGSVPGLIAGSLLGVLVNAVACEDEGGDPCLQAIPLFGLAGGAAGALLGAIVGSAIPKWHRRVP